MKEIKNPELEYNLTTPPEGLQWSGDKPIPAVGKEVDISGLRGFGPKGIVTAYFREYTWLGFHVDVGDRRPKWHKEQRPNDTIICCFGIDLR